MSIANIKDAQEVESSLQSILEAPDTNTRIQAIRVLFVESLDYGQDDRRVPLETANNDQLPGEAHVVARRDGVSVVYVPLDGADNNRISGAMASAAAKAVGNVLADDLLLLFTNRDCDQLHIINPDLTGSRPRLQRMVVHRGQRPRTVVEQISNMWDNYGNRGKTVREAIAIAFNVEPVTKQFFETYHLLFNGAKAQIEGFGDDEEEQRHLFTQTLFNRLMFIYFLSRKGWLKFQGDADYLNALWRDYPSLPGDSNFYANRLDPLFFAGLNNPQSLDLNVDNPGLHALIGRVPFLNGGLFERNDLDQRDGITVPDSAIERILSGLFDRFNFTVMESTPFDVEVAVDPEMLGKVFEELVTGRHDSGAYYTPRPVVSFMCREALKGYMDGQDTGVDADAIAQFVDRQDPSGLNLAAARRISEALTEVTVVDPACGSGAYLLGMMQELIELQTTLYNVGVDSKAVYELKLEIIQRNLYGVDIDEVAINIAMLRMWLSLAIDYEGATPEPLPNLDFKVVCGDSLRGPDPSAGVEVQGTLGQDTAQMRRLGELKGEYLRASTGADKERLRQDIQELTGQIRDALGVTTMDGVVDWRVEFAEVFANRRGFDVAIANPPYGITVKDRRSAAMGHADSYTNFMGLAVEIASNGVMAYITPTSWETGERFQKFRQFLFGKMALQSVVNLPYDVFDTPYVDTAITIGTMGQPPKWFGIATLEKRTELDLTRIGDYMTRVDWSVVSGDSGLRVPMLDWAVNLFGRVGSNATPLGQITSSKRGIEAYQFDILTRAEPDTLPFFSGQVQRYEIQSPLADNFVAVSNRELTYHRGPRIWTRRIVNRSNRLLSALTSDDFVVKKDIYVTKSSFDDRHKISALLAILNSSLMSFLYLSRSAAAVKDDFRQVTLSGLRELPIIFPDRKGTQELAELVAARERQENDIEDLERRIDNIVYRTYGITDAEQEAIETWLARSG